MIFALVGNQNCGKTTLFNALTGSNQHVGNFPGVTVDQKMGEMRDEKGCSVVDLPGIYSLRPYTQEEIVSRDFIIHEKPDGIINIVDATNIERNLYLTLQLLELRVPMVLALNMMDEVHANGGAIDVQKMSQALGRADLGGEGGGRVRAGGPGADRCAQPDAAEGDGLLLGRFGRAPLHPRGRAPDRRPRRPHRRAGALLRGQAH